MNGAMFNSLARFIDKNYPQVSFTDLCQKASLKTNVFAELTWYADKDFTKIMQALSEQTDTEINTLWRELGRDTFSYFSDIFGDYMAEVKNLSDLITAINRIHHEIKRDSLGNPPRIEFKKAQSNHFEFRYSSEINLNDFFLGMLEGAVKHFQTDAKILGRKEHGKLVVTISTKQPETVMV